MHPSRLSSPPGKQQADVSDDSSAPLQGLGDLIIDFFEMEINYVLF
jgi:hypothetical protein